MGVPLPFQLLQADEPILTSESQLNRACPCPVLIVYPLINIGATHDAKAFLIIVIHFVAVVGIGMPNQIIPRCLSTLTIH